MSRELLQLTPRTQAHYEVDVESPVFESRTFISYPLESREFARRLSDDLRKNGFQPWIDEANLPRSDAWQQEIQNAIERADCMIAVIDGSSAASSTTRSEWHVALTTGKRIIPILVAGDVASRPPELQRFLFLDFRNTAEYSESFKNLLEALGKRHSLGQLFGVPALAESFVPRAEILQRAEKALRGAAPVGLVGNGGNGKTMLAIALARDTHTRQVYQGGIFYIPAYLLDESSEDPEASLLFVSGSAYANCSESHLQLRSATGFGAGLLPVRIHARSAHHEA